MMCVIYGIIFIETIIVPIHTPPIDCDCHANGSVSLKKWILFLHYLIPLCIYTLFHRKINLWLSGAKTREDGWYLASCAIGCIVAAMPFFILYDVSFSRSNTLLASFHTLPFLFAFFFMLDTHRNFVTFKQEQRKNYILTPIWITWAWLFCLAIQIAGLSIAFKAKDLFKTNRPLSEALLTWETYVLPIITYLFLYYTYKVNYLRVKPDRNFPEKALASCVFMIFLYISMIHIQELLNRHDFLKASSFMILCTLIPYMYTSGYNEQINTESNLKKSTLNSHLPKWRSVLSALIAMGIFLFILPDNFLKEVFTINIPYQKGTIIAPHFDGIIFAVIALPVFHWLYISFLSGGESTWIHKGPEKSKNPAIFVGIATLMFVYVQFSPTIAPTNLYCDKNIRDLICRKIHDGKFKSCPKLLVFRPNNIIPGSCDQQ